MKIKHLISILIVIIGTVAISFSVNATHEWADHHWARTSNPLPLQIVRSITVDWENEFSLSTEYPSNAQSWAYSAVLELDVVDGDTGGKLRKQCPMILGKIRVCNARYGGAWLGMATIGLDTNGHIDQGTAQVNDFFSNYWNSKPQEKYHVMCQEIGHLFGLGHTSVNGTSQGTCMDYSDSSQYNESQYPNIHDFGMLAGIYSHMDSYDSYDDDSGTDGGGNSDKKPCNAPQGKGCNQFGGAKPGTNPMGFLIQRSENFEVWVAPRGDGGMWIRHVRLPPREYRRR
ncbi:MAG: hypothetical protein HRT54_16305 [Colwellia sp.]|nr:hypothetical protein [Colwellia sp.]